MVVRSARFRSSDALVMSARWSANVTDHDRVYGATRVRRLRKPPCSVRRRFKVSAGAHKWIAGAALQYERLHTSDVAGVSFDYTRARIVRAG